MFLGYHYTSFSNWKLIKKQGLVPYTLQPHIIRAFPPCEGPVSHEGIYVHSRPLTRREHTGSILYQVISKHTPSVALLGVSYKECEMMLTTAGSRITLFHNLEDSGPLCKYWHDEVPARLLASRIPPRRVKLMGVFNVEDCIPEFPQPVKGDKQ